MEPNLLIADSDAALCDLYQRFLNRHDYQVAIASDGLDCLKKLRQARPSLLVLERELRWGGGDGVLAWLREERAGSEVAVVLTTTGGSLPNRADAMEPPVVRFLPKPFTLAALLDTVRAAVARKGRVELFNRNRATAGSELFIG
jgi:DNA-binding response OmpR family regulator